MFTDHLCLLADEQFDLKGYAAATSAFIALLALIATITVTKISLSAGRRPILVFIWGEKGWKIRNVGPGPAMDVVVAQVKKGVWYAPTRIPPMGKDSEFDLHWLGGESDWGLGASYRDVKEKPYSSRCGDDLTTIKAGCLVKAWNEKIIAEWEKKVTEDPKVNPSTPVQT